ncbi:hypothetical protein JRO89_XS15G0159900 [Xanthoceras sorbifolium]|uniref:Uncharacterized protein n=1 Tax=Xanthoceras sorbifolium TaxID=99658 RepID=A0ABQ8H2H2_9ROSI|nr:hypothetical protein JRO89_XS15G0159900 [Xanthoceras sorbifolium]
MENGYGPYGYGLYRQGSTGVWSSLRDGDFEEEDVWAVLKERSKDSNSIFELQNSVKRIFEGVGRTLKGRDLSKVRNAVLTKTGFLE